MGGQNINESQDTLANLKDKSHTIQHSATSTADHTFPGGTATFLRADGTFASPPAGTGSGTPSGTVVAETTYAVAAAAGTSGEYSRGDHTHGTPADLVTGTAHASLSAGVHGLGTMATQSSAAYASTTNLDSHATASSGVHGSGTATLATTADITTHSNLTTGVHSLGTMALQSSAAYASTTVYAAHTSAGTAHGVTQIAGTVDIATHAALTTTHSMGTMALAASAAFTGTATYAAHTVGSNMHGAGTIAGLADIVTHAALTTGIHGVGTSLVASLANITDVGLITTDNTTNNASTAKHGFLLKLTAATANFLRADGAWAAPPAGTGGSDPWTYKSLSVAFTTTSATAQAVTGLAFSPVASTKYDIFGMFVVKTASSAIVPRVGLAFPTGCSQGVASIYITAGASTQYLVNLADAASGLTSVGAFASTANFPSQLNALVVAGTGVAGSVQVQFCSEGAGTAVTMQPGSFIKYRSYT